jgi:prepilin-type N-terminal cleavage/methylation domain-containing protein
MDRFYKIMKRNNRGFTLVELMIVVVIIGVLVAIAVPVYNSTQKKAKETACEANIRTIEGAAAQYHAANGKWPSMEELDEEYLKEEPKCPFRSGDLETNEHDYNINTGTGEVTCENTTHTPANP